MAKFSEGQRVRVPRFSPFAENSLWGKEGVVVSVLPQVNVDDSSVEQGYRVRFDGEEAVVMYERQLEAV